MRKYTVIENSQLKHGVTLEEESLALDYQYALRDLNEFEKRKAEMINDQLKDLYEYMETTTLY